MDMYDTAIYAPKFKFTKDTFRAHKLHNGDIFTIDPEGMCALTGRKRPFLAGERLSDRGSHILRVYYTPKKWWQFWKRKKVIAYKVIWHEVV